MFPAQPQPGMYPPTRGISDALNAFWNDHADWARALPGDGLHYAIPIAALSGPELERVFGARLVVEREYAQLCDRNGMVGVWRYQAVFCHLLTRQPLQLDRALVAALGWSDQQVANISRAADRTGIAHDRLLGVVGWLLTEPAFLAEVAALRGEYEALPGTDRPCFPLGRTMVWNAPGPRSEIPSNTSVFQDNLCRFLDRWGLTRLVTWDLPEPQGPLLPNLLPDGPARPAHGIHIFVPLHYPLQGDDDLLTRVREFQRQQATELGLPSGIAGIAHHNQYAQMFRLIHLDRAVRGRFCGRVPRGLVSALEVAAASYLDISPESVRRLWKWIRTCRRNRRATIRQLRD